MPTPRTHGQQGGSSQRPGLPIASVLPNQEPTEDTHLLVQNSGAYHGLREAVSLNTFQRLNDSPWPTAPLEKANSRGHAQLVPLAFEKNSFVLPEQGIELSEKMFKECAKLSDFDADVLDLLSNIWLSRMKTSDGLVMVAVDELLAMRGLEPKHGQDGRNSGYRPGQRLALLEAIERVQSLWVNFSRLEIFNRARNGKRTREYITAQSRAFIITDRIIRQRLDGGNEIVKIFFRPGHIFSQFLVGPGRQIALLARKAIEYDPYRQTWEKRLARYFSWQWRIRASSGTYLSPFSVCTLLRRTGVDPNGNPRPHRVRQRLEKALDTLEKDRVIKTWQYRAWEEAAMNRAGWFEIWLNANVAIEPTEEVTTHYRSIVRPKAIRTDSVRGTHNGLHDRLRDRRIQRRLTLLVAAEQIGIHHTLLCRIEKGNRNPSQTVGKRIENWLAQIDKL